MSFRGALAAASIAWLLLLIPAEARGPNLPPASFRLAPPGSTFFWRSTTGDSTIVIGRPDGFLARWMVNGRLNSGYLVANYAEAPYLSPRAAEKLVGIWPLSVGKTVTYDREDPASDADLRWRDEIAVLGTDKIKIGGHDIDTYIVRWSSTGLGRNPWHGEMTVWFAPALGWTVKAHVAEVYPTENFDAQVVGYKLAR